MRLVENKHEYPHVARFAYRLVHLNTEHISTVLEEHLYKNVGARFGSDPESKESEQKNPSVTWWDPEKNKVTWTVMQLAAWHQHFYTNFDNDGPLELRSIPDVQLRAIKSKTDFLRLAW